MPRPRELRLSYGAISAYLACPRRYEVVYLQKLRPPTSGLEHRGSAVHSALEQYLNGGSVMEWHDLKRTLESEFQEGIDDIEWGVFSPVQLLDEAVEGLERYYHEVLPKLRPAEGGVELAFERRLEPGNILLRGRIDGVMTNGTIVDHKTSRRSPPQREADISLQPTVYFLGLGMKQGGRVALGYMVFLKKGIRTNILFSERSRDDIEWLRDQLIPQVARGIREEFFPPRPAWHCASCHVRREHCGYRKDWS